MVPNIIIFIKHIPTQKYKIRERYDLGLLPMDYKSRRIRNLSPYEKLYYPSTGEGGEFAPSTPDSAEGVFESTLKNNV